MDKFIPLLLAALCFLGAAIGLMVAANSEMFDGDAHEGFIRKTLAAAGALSTIITIFCLLGLAGIVVGSVSSTPDDAAIQCRTANGTYSLQTGNCYRDGKKLMFNEEYEYI